MRNVKDSSTQTDPIKDGSTGSTPVQKSKTQQLMDESYRDRRISIFLKRPRIIEIKEQYPALFSTSEIRKELDRIFYPGKSEEFLNHITKYASEILEGGKNKKLYSVIKGCMEEAKSEDDRKYALQVGAILMLPVVVCQNADRKSVSFLRFKLEDPDEECDPYIYVNIDDLTELCMKKHLCKIIVEGVKVGETFSFVEAVLVYFACFFTFDIVYPDKDLDTHVAMERLFLNANETEEISDYSSEVMKRLKATK
ncbi:uncharacterized protein LOC129234562 isoform X2 [Uloborus diversus]|nr:uncharacterized protein LOC129234562 isoform X2 [Uloborus diversus]